jgi:CRP-like cAMP-binding protein
MHEIDSLGRKLGAYADLDSEELAILASIQGEKLEVAHGRELIFQGQTQHAAYVLHDGWACSSKQLENGTRQVIDIQVPGDFLGLRSLMLRMSDHSIVALTDIKVRRIHHDKLWPVLSKAPRLSSALLWALARDQAVIVEHLVSLGRRDARARTVHFLLELGARMTLAGHGDANGFECPLTQSMLADALGITAIHLNRVLRQLRLANLLLFRDHFVTFCDVARLSAITDFDSSFLDQKE